MTFPKRYVVTPGANGAFALVAVAVSLFVFAYSTRFGKLPILALYAVWMVPVLVEPRILLRALPRTLALFGLAGLAIASTLWSDAPSTTLRAGIQYGSTIACAVIASRVLSLTDLARSAVFGILLVLAFSLFVGRHQYDAIDGTYALVGAFGSKNQLGFFASLGILFGGTVVVADKRFLMRLAALGLVVLSVAVLAASQSATSVLTVAAALVAVAGVAIAGRIAPTARLVLCAFLVFVLLGGVFAALDGGAFGDILGVFGKDATLTGRTYLWSEGISFANDRPFFGMGYNAFWVVGNPDAERLWEEFYITARTGFHFHNTFIQGAVDLGMVGLSAIVLLLVWLLAALARALFRGKVTTETALAAGLIVLLLSRAMVEIDFLTPYTVGTFLLYACLERLSPHARRMAARGAAARPPARRRWSLGPRRTPRLAPL